MPFNTFMLAFGMGRDDTFKVLSYLTDFIEKELDLELCSYKSVSALNHILDIDRLDFRRLNVSLNKGSVDIVNLFTITGRVQLFKKSGLHQNYFE